MNNAACLLLSVVIALPLVSLDASEPVEFKAGFAEVDITPPPGLPMWGYGARHAAKAKGTMDSLAARAVVIQAGNSKVAVVGLDLGRAPTAAMMEQIRGDLKEQADIEHILISGSHTHHGPVIELVDKTGYGKGAFDEAVAYSQELPRMLTDVILAADKAAQPARIGVGTCNHLKINRNRHTKRDPKTVDPGLFVVRFDDQNQDPIAVIVSFAAHPTMTDVQDLRYSGDYPGYMARKVSSDLNAGCVFMQGASGDLSVRPPAGVQGPQAFGELLAAHVVTLTKGIEAVVPESPAISGRVNRYQFRSRVDFGSALVQLQYSVAFFPELIRNAVDEFATGIPAELNTVVLNGDIAFVGGSGEFFCNHAIRLRERAYVDHVLFFGYCNGHSLYFPTIEAVSEGGYGADAPVSPAEVGAGEQMLNCALVNIYELLGRIEPVPSAE